MVTESNLQFRFPRLPVYHPAVLAKLDAVLKAQKLALRLVAHVVMLAVVASQLVHVLEDFKLRQVHPLLTLVSGPLPQLLAHVAEVVALPVVYVQFVDVVEVQHWTEEASRMLRVNMTL